MMLAGKCAVVTGGASPRGIGWAIAKTFAEHGARVAILDLRGPEAAESAAAIGPMHRGFACDVRDPEACRAATAQAAAAFGGLDILVANAGVSEPRKLLDITQEGYDRVVDTSLRGALNMAQAVVPYLLDRGGGSIVAIGSVSGERGGGVMGGAHYSAAKGGVHSLVKAMAREFAAEGIRINAVAPGLIETDLIAGRLDAERRAAVIAATPMGRIGTPAEVAGACLFLTSDLAAYVHGVTLDVNGGLHIH